MVVSADAKLSFDAFNMQIRAFVDKLIERHMAAKPVVRP